MIEEIQSLQQESISDTLFFQMEVDDIKYEIHIGEDENGELLPYGIINDNTELPGRQVDIEQLVGRIVYIFGYKKKIPVGKFSFVIDNITVRGKEKREIAFYGPFGSLRIDESSDLQYDTTTPNP